MANSVHYGLLEKVQTQIRALITAGTIPTILSADVLIRKVPIAIDYKTAPATGEFQLPGIVISYIPKMQVQPWSNLRDRIGYPILIDILAKDSQDATSNHDVYLKWHEDILDEFRTRRVTLTSPAASFLSCDYDPVGQIVSWPAWAGQGLHVSSIPLVFWMLKTRGN